MRKFMKTTDYDIVNNHIIQLFETIIIYSIVNYHLCQGCYAAAS